MADWFCDKQVVNFSSSFPLPNTASVYIFAGGGGDCKQHRTVMCKNAKMYRSLYGRFVYLLLNFNYIYDAGATQ